MKEFKRIHGTYPLEKGDLVYLDDAGLRLTRFRVFGNHHGRVIAHHRSWLRGEFIVIIPEDQTIMYKHGKIGLFRSMFWL